MTKTKWLIAVLLGQILVSCNNDTPQQKKVATQKSGPKTTKPNDSIVYQSENLLIRKLTGQVYEHISFLQTQDFGKVPCNGMIVVNNHEAIIFDTPTDEENSEELINYLTKNLHCTINAVVATHFHKDCLGGLAAFHKQDIPSYAHKPTITLARAKKFVVPQKGFEDQINLSVGDKNVEVAYFGAGHTRDNVVAYFPDDNIMFGGCLIKEVGAGKGNLEDADTSAWSATVRKVKLKYPQTKIVIPGHGEYGGTELLDYTINLFK